MRRVTDPLAFQRLEDSITEISTLKKDNFMKKTALSPQFFSQLGSTS
jgi:hypothetical protein